MQTRSNQYSLTGVMSVSKSDRVLAHNAPLAKFTLGFFSIFVLIVSIYRFMDGSAASNNWTLDISIILIAWLTVYLTTTYLHYRSLYLFTSVYILCLCLFHLGITVPDAFNIFPDLKWPKQGPMAVWLEKAGWITLLALSCIGIGCAFAMKPYMITNYSQPANSVVLSRNRKIIFWYGLGLLVASAIFFTMVIATFGNILSYSRVDFFRGVADTRGLGLFLMTFPSSVLLLVIGAQTRLEKYFAGTIAIVAFVFIMLSGYRTSALFPLLVGAVIWTKIGQKLPVLYAGVAVLGIVTSIPVVGYLRGTGAYEDIQSNDIKKSVEQSTIQETFRTVGQTGGLLAHVLRLVPDQDDYRYGTTYIKAIAGSVPNVTFTQAKSERVTAKQEMFKDQEAINRTAPSDWLTYRVARERFDRGEGVGFTGIGEPYLNFGIPGIIIFFLALGFLLGRFDQKPIGMVYKATLFAGAVLWPLMRTVRDDLNNFIKPAIFTLIILGIWYIGSRMFFPDKVSR
jgi:oligosaccharide repeat unit polymerase